ncbi:MAG: peroxidase [Acidobacteria bacterium]|nr:MAG: peroxidase [Acidobacteriota bacterium]
MAHISIVDPASATGELADLYARIASARGGVADVHQVQSLNPRAMAAHLELYKAILFQPSSLSRAWREAIGVAVSRANGCAYCVAHHEAALAGLPPAPAPTALLEWATRLTEEPAVASAADVSALRELGLDDRAILDAILTVGYFNFVNRLVLATGIEIEANYTDTCKPA